MSGDASLPDRVEAAARALYYATFSDSPVPIEAFELQSDDTRRNCHEIAAEVLAAADACEAERNLNTTDEYEQVGWRSPKTSSYYNLRDFPERSPIEEPPWVPVYVRRPVSSEGVLADLVERERAERGGVHREERIMNDGSPQLDLDAIERRGIDGVLASRHVAAVALDPAERDALVALVRRLQQENKELRSTHVGKYALRLRGRVEELTALANELLDEYVDACHQGSGSEPLSSPTWHMFMSTYEHATELIPRARALLARVDPEKETP